MNLLNKIINNLKVTLEIIKLVNLPYEKYAWGGGSALAFKFHHRFSKDIDLFLYDPQWLGILTPRLNDDIEKLVKDYLEGPTFLKLYFSDFEIDFIVSRRLTGIPNFFIEIEDYKVPVESDIEIIAKKIFYKGLSLKIRDIIDIGTVYKNISPDERKEMIKILAEMKLIPKPEEILFQNLNRLKLEIDEKTLKELSLEKPITVEDFLHFVELTEELIKKAMAYQPYFHGEKPSTGRQE